MPSLLENSLNRRAQAEYGVPTWGDYGTRFKMGVAEMAATVPALTQWGAGFLPGESSFEDEVVNSSAYLRDKLHEYSEGSFEQLSPVSQERLATDLLTSKEFWEHPFSTLALQTTGQIPTLAATGLSMLLTGGGTSALVAAGLAGGTLGMGQSVDAMIEDANSIPDAELREQNPVYDQLRADGLNEKTARKQVTQSMIGAKPLAVFAVSAATNAFGPAAQGMRALGLVKGAGLAAKGNIARRVGKEAAQGALSEGIEETAQSAFQEQARVDVGSQRDINLGNIAQGGISGATLGFVMGGPAGIPRARQARTPAANDTTNANPRAHADNPPGRNIDLTIGPPGLPGGAVPVVPEVDPTIGPPSMPPRGGDTQGTPGIVPDSAPQGTGKQIPGKVARDGRASKRGKTPQEPAEAVPTAGAVPTQAGALAPPTGLPGAAQAVPTGLVANDNSIVMDSTQAAAVDALKPRRGARQPLPEPVTGAGPAPPPTPPSVQPPLEGVGPGAGTTATPVVGLQSQPRTEAVSTGEPALFPDFPTGPVEGEPAEFPRQPRTIEGRRVLETVPDQATLDLMATRREQLESRGARIVEAPAEAAPAGQAVLKGKNKKRNQKLLDDGAKAQELLDARPRELEVQSVPELTNTLQGILGSARKAGITLREKVGYDTTPDSLVWLAEARALLKKLGRADVDAEAKLDAMTRFLDGEQQLINEGNASVFRGARKVEGEAQGRGAYEVPEDLTDTGEILPAPRVSRGTNRPGLGIESYSESHKLPLKEGDTETKTRQQVAQGEENVSLLTPAERAAAIAEKEKELKRRPKKLTAKAEKAMTVADKRAATKKAAEKFRKESALKAKAREAREKELEKTRKESAILATAQAREEAQALAKAEKARKKPRPSKLEKELATAAARKAEAEAKRLAAEEQAEEQARARKETTPRTKKALAALEQSRRAQARKQAEKEALSKERAAKRVPLALLGKKTLKVELAKVEESPSPAKVEADNFTKGHVSIEGVPVSLETKTGFGEIPGSRGADGGPVKILLGEEAVPGNKSLRDLPVVVIDQVNPTDHVVLYGFEDPQAAVNEFDGNFPDRVGDFAIMSYDEFRTWLASKSAEPVGVPEVEPQLMENPPGWDTVEAGGEFPNRLTPEQQQNMTDIVRQVAGDVRVEFQESFEKETGPGARAWGKEETTPGAMFLKAWDEDGIVTQRLIRFAMNLQLVSNKAAFHEAWHAIERALGRPRLSLLAKEMPRLRKMAQEDYMMSEADAARLADSEVLAVAFARWAADKPKGINAGLRRYFKAVNEFLRRLGNAFKGMGFRTAEDVFGEAYRGEFRGVEQYVDAGPSSAPAAQFLQLTDLLPEPVTSALKRLPRQVQARATRKWALWLSTLDNLAQNAKFYGVDFYEPVRKVADTIERIRVAANTYIKKWAPLMLKMREAQNNYKGTPWWDHLMQLMHDETSAGVFSHLPLALQKFLGGEGSFKGAYPRGRHGELYTRWDALPDDLKALRLEVLEFYQQRQNEIHFRKLKNILRVAGHTDPALAHRLFNGKETKADKDLLGAIYENLIEAEEMIRISGPYYPQMRRGNWVVRALYKIKPPHMGNGTRAIPDEDTGEVNTWEFGGHGISVAEAERRALAFAGSQTDMFPTVSSVWVKASTGERFFTNDKGEEQRVDPNDPDAEKRFKVSIQNQFVNYYPTQAEAQEVAAELKADTNVIDVKGVEERRFQPDGKTADVASVQMRALARSLRRQQRYKNMTPEEQDVVDQTLLEASLRILSHTRIQTRNLPRKHVLGASTDATTNMGEYAQSASGYMARLDHQQDLNEAMREARLAVGTDAHKSAGRSVLMNELESRVASAGAFPDSKGLWNGIASRWMVLSYLARLVSPATNMLNMLQPITTTLPLLAARHGPGRAAREMLRVYKVTRTGKTLKAGISATARAFSKNFESPTMMEDILATQPAGVRSMLKELMELGSIDPDAGIEMEAIYNAGDTLGARADRSLDSLQRFGRQMPRAIETINRTVTAIAAYNLELQKNGGDHAKAVRYAQEMTNLTQGIYSHTNAAPVFKHPLARISFQFKQYAQLIYNIMAHQFEKAYHNAEPGDRAEAIKSFAYMMGAYTVVAGTLGLPTEPIKLVFMLAGGSIGGVTWGDIEHWERELAADMFGQNMGEILTHGISRALPGGLAFDLSGRAGLQDLLLFGEPRANDEQAVWAYMGELVAGAPGALLADWFKGAQALKSGEFAEAAQKLAPLKVASDLIKSYRVSTEGKKSGAGYQTLTPYSGLEAAVRTFGFTPAREAEAGAASRYFYAREERGTAERQSYLHQWAAASPPERARLWGQVEKRNRGKPEDEQLSRADLDRYAKSRRTQEKSRRGGLRVTRREQSLYGELESVYNIAP